MAQTLVVWIYKQVKEEQSKSRINYRNVQVNVETLWLALYDTLRGIGAARLNLKAAVATATEIILFQRGNIADNNALIAYDRATFTAYLAEPTRALPQPQITLFALPQRYNRRAGFSAATLLNATQILFAASVKDTPDEIQDGPTFGNFIGLLQARQNGACSGSRRSARAAKSRR